MMIPAMPTFAPSKKTIAFGKKSTKKRDFIYNPLPMKLCVHIVCIAVFCDLDGETFNIEFIDKKERLFYVLSIKELPDKAEKAKGVFERLERIIYD